MPACWKYTFTEITHKSFSVVIGYDQILTDFIDILQDCEITLKDMGY